MSPRAGTEDEMIEHAVRFMLDGGQDARVLVRSLIARWPEITPLQIIFVMSMAAGGAEHMIAGKTCCAFAHDVWRMASLVGVDLYVMERMNLPRDTSADLIAYWKTNDPFFLS